MPTPRSDLRITTLQIRTEAQAIRQEQECFRQKCGVSPAQMNFINVVETPNVRFADVADAHVVIIGGAGSFSVTEDYPFTQPLTDLVLELLERDRPIFGSCWGHQFIARVLGGTVISDPESSEVGSHDVAINPAAMHDPLLSNVAARFTAQLGHCDRVSELGPDLLELAYSARCPNQIIRHRDKPVYGTQFHCELDAPSLLTRLEYYRETYAPNPGDFDRIITEIRPSLEADKLLPNFLHAYA